MNLSTRAKNILCWALVDGNREAFKLISEDELKRRVAAQGPLIFRMQPNCGPITLKQISKWAGVAWDDPRR